MGAVPLYQASRASLVFRSNDQREEKLRAGYSFLTEQIAGFLTDVMKLRCCEKSLATITEILLQSKIVFP